MREGKIGIMGGVDPPDSVQSQVGWGVAEVKFLPATFAEPWLDYRLKKEFGEKCWLPDDANFRIQRGSPVKKQDC
eukprot:2825638-Rhodomonas_salina.1